MSADADNNAVAPPEKETRASRPISMSAVPIGWRAAPAPAARAAAASGRTGPRWVLIVGGRETVVCASKAEAWANASGRGLGGGALVVCRTFYEGGPAAAHAWRVDHPHAADPANPPPAGGTVTVEHMFTSRAMMQAFCDQRILEGQAIFRAPA